MLGLLIATCLHASAPTDQDPGSPRVSVVWRGERCPALDLEARVEDYLSRSTTPTTTALSTTIQLDRTLDGTWRLELQLGHEGAAGGKRAFTADACETLIDAAAFVIAVTIDPRVEDGDADESSIPEPVPPIIDAPTTAPRAGKALILDEPNLPNAWPSTSSSSSSRETEETRRSSTGSQVRLRGHVGASGGIMLGGLPDAGGVLAGTAGVGGRTWRVGVVGTHRFATHKAATLDPDAGGRLSLWSVGLRGCGVVAFDRVPLEVPLCADLEGGQVVGTGFGFQGAGSTRRPWGAAGASAGLAWFPHRVLSLGIEAGFGLPFARTKFVIEGLETLHRIGAVFGRALVAVQVRFP
jgi:hypothetical protein